MRFARWSIVFVLVFLVSVMGSGVVWAASAHVQGSASLTVGSVTQPTGASVTNPSYVLDASGVTYATLNGASGGGGILRLVVGSGVRLSQVRIDWSATSAGSRSLTLRDSSGAALESWSSTQTSETTNTYNVTSVSGVSFIDVQGPSGSGNVGNVFGVSADAYVGPPGQVGGLIATAGQQSVTLTWSPVVGATGYLVRRDGVVVASSVSGTSYTDSGLVSGVSYDYAVAASNSAGTGSYSASVSVVPLAGPPAVPGVPAGFGVTPGNLSAVLSWSAPTDGGSPEGYRIYRGSMMVREVGPGVLTYVDSSLTDGQSYSYKVAAYNVSGVSAFTPVLTITAAEGPVTGSPVLQAGVVTGTSVPLTWSTVAGATGYYVYRDGALVGSLSFGVSFTDSGLQPNTSYTYWVKGMNGQGMGPESNHVSVTTGERNWNDVGLEIAEGPIKGSEALQESYYVLWPRLLVLASLIFAGFYFWSIIRKGAKSSR